MLIPDRKDLPRHVTNKLNEAQLKLYRKICYDMAPKLIGTYGQNIVLSENCFGELVFSLPDKLILLAKPTPIADNQTKVEIIKFNSLPLVGDEASEKMAFVFANPAVKHLQFCTQQKETHFQAPCNGMFPELPTPPVIKEFYDLNGYYYSIELTNSNSKAKVKLIVDEENLEFVLRYPPKYSKNSLIVYYATPDGKWCTARLSRVFMAKALYNSYDHRLISDYLQVVRLNRNHLHQRLINLRLCTAIENNSNSKLNHHLKETGRYLGYGVKEIEQNVFEVKAYKLTKRSNAKPAETKIFNDLQKGLDWKMAIEEKLLKEIGVYDQLTPPITYKQSNPLPIKDAS